MRLYYYCFFFK